MRTLLVILSCVFVLWLCGCSREKPAPKAQSPGDIQAQMDKVQNDPQLPPQTKMMVLGHMQREKEMAQWRQSRQGTSQTR